MTLSPVLAIIYNKLGSRGKDFHVAQKFAMGMTLCSMAFLLLFVCRFFADSSGMVSAWWLVGGYFFQSTGELLIGALGMAMISELVPQKIVGFAMGMWFLKSAISGMTGSMVAKFTAIPKDVASGIVSLDIYTGVFWKIGVVIAIIALIMWLTSGKLVRYISGDIDVSEVTLEPEGNCHHKVEEIEKSRV